MFNLFKNLKPEKKLKVDSFLSNAGLYLIGIVSLGYLLFSRKFAEFHLQLSFLDFPIFIGEITLSLCLIILIIKWINKPPKFKTWHCFLILYLVFVLIKAFWGYHKWGALAFRQAALFYYPLFAIFGYFFYRRKFFGPKINLFLILLLIVIFKFIPFRSYCLLTCLVLAFILIKSHPSKIGKYILFSLLLISAPFTKLLYTSRTMSVSNIAAGAYFILVLPFVLKIKKSLRLVIIIMLTMLISLSIIKKMEDKTVSCLFDFRQIKNLHSKYNNIIAENKKNSVIVKIIERVSQGKGVNLYNPEGRRAEKSEISQKVVVSPQPEVTQIKDSEAVRIEREIEELEYEVQKAPSSTRLTNVFFRLFIWQDMFKDFRREKPILGFDFGKPFRSESIEFSFWAVGEWSRDGWIASHNSYLEIIYRAGIIGLLFIMLIFIAVFKIVKKSIQFKSVTGALLSAVLINWLMATNFLPILELPYNAIPFWSLFGLACSYAKGLK